MDIKEKDIELFAYRLIRIACRKFDRKTTDAELANYIMGIVDLQTELYGLISNKSDWIEKSKEND